MKAMDIYEMRVKFVVSVYAYENHYWFDRMFAGYNVLFYDMRVGYETAELGLRILQ